uniref:Uncharacterized protein n=1 Tax=Anguilla anguilla TaxID=7936 RepID=A0A0E9PB34_ANGAN
MSVSFKNTSTFRPKHFQVPYMFLFA